MPIHSNPLQNDRIVSLDMMRGFALFGIFVANSVNFQFGLFPTPELHHLYPLGVFDRIAEIFILFFAKASFYTLFSFLFGYGMALLKERLEYRNLPFATIYWRRMFILLVIGFLHGLFIWDGDILFVYAMTAFIFYFFLKLKGRGLLIWSLLLLLLMASSIAGNEEESTTLLDEQLFSYSAAEKTVLSSGSYAATILFRLHSDPLGMGVIGDIILNVTSMISVLGMFLLGAFVARKKWLEDVTNHSAFIKRIWWMTLLIGFPCKLAYILHDSYQNEMLHTTVGGPMTAMFYASSIALLASTEKGRALLQPLSYAGRLSFTNYLMQSIVFTTIFYGYGIGLFNKIGYFAGVLLVIGFFFLQVVVSTWWLRRFYVGPLEWVWRIGTYLRIPKLMRKASIQQADHRE
ncbi:DUF418 domain-containing protein [bacterium LRH843]|nr:DUF418 domain-containing protein [bacterium LRH843]